MNQPFLQATIRWFFFYKCEVYLNFIFSSHGGPYYPWLYFNFISTLPHCIQPWGAAPNVKDKPSNNVKDKKAPEKVQQGKGKGSKGKTKSKTKSSSAKAKSTPTEKGKGMKRPAAAAVAYGETMGGGDPPAEPTEPPNHDQKEKNEKSEKDNYVLMLYKSRNIAAVRESKGSKKQVLQVRFKDQKITISSNTFPTKGHQLISIMFMGALQGCGSWCQLGTEQGDGAGFVQVPQQRWTLVWCPSN